MKCLRDKDLVSLGRTLGRLITTTEYSVSEGGFQSIDPVTGQPEFPDVGLPFKMWTDALPVCAKALRDTGNAKDLDLAIQCTINKLLQTHCRVHWSSATQTRYSNKAHL